jgi:serine/threonine protein phosphatase 1
MDERLFAIGDIHGCLTPFMELVEQKIKFKHGDKLVLLGDYIDRGYQSREVVDYIINLQQKEFDIIALLGNHESMLLNTLDSEELFSIWSLNGCFETLESFGITRLKELDQRYIDFFKNLLYYWSYKQFIFVHAGFNDDMKDPFDDKTEMIWTRRKKYKNPVFKDRVIVHGHSPVPESVCKQRIMEKDQVLNLDTGCVYTDREGYGRLSAIELYSMQVYSVPCRREMDRDQ